MTIDQAGREPAITAWPPKLSNEQGAALQKLREPFPEHQQGLLPKPYQKDAPKGRCSDCGGWHGLPAAHVPFVGHAALTARLLDVDLCWYWEPIVVDECGGPKVDKDGGCWIWLHVAGMSRRGYGSADPRKGADATKERIGDALRNAGMRFGMALEYWHKGDLYVDEVTGEVNPPKKTSSSSPAKPAAPAPREPGEDDGPGPLAAHYEKQFRAAATAAAVNGISDQIKKSASIFGQADLENLRACALERLRELHAASEGKAPQ